MSKLDASMPDDERLELVRQRLAARFRNMLVEPASSTAHLIVRLGSGDRSLVGIRIDDPTVPSFEVTYTRLRAARKGEREFSEIQATGVLEAGLDWIIEKVARHGYVPPEVQ